MKCIRFDVCKIVDGVHCCSFGVSSMKCIRFDVCKCAVAWVKGGYDFILNEVHTF